MQFNDIYIKKNVGLITWLKFMFKVQQFIALNVFLVAVKKRHVSHRPFELQINTRYFWKPQNDCFQLVNF